MPKFTEPQARAAYLAMGASRSLRQLARQYADQGLGSASAVCRRLERFSAEHSWPTLAAAHDEMVARKAAERVAHQQAKKAADLVTHLITAAAEGLTRAVAIAAQETRFKDLVEGSVAALKAAEVISGGVSDRIEQHQRTHLERAKAVRKEMEEMLGISQGPEEPKLH